MIYSNKTIEMNIGHKFIEAEFIDRPNRFLTRVKLDGEIVESHLPDPGRLKELLIPGARILLKKESGINRKTQFSTQAVYADDILISLNTLVPNKFVSYLLKNQGLAFLKGWKFHKQEVTYGNSRFDFQLSKDDKIMVLEVKSVTLVEQGIAKFPDAVTARGRKHVQHLAKLATEGLDVMILFVVQRPDAVYFQPQWERDPAFGRALFKAWGDGLQIRVIKMKMTMDTIYNLGEIPYQLNSGSE